MSVAATARCLRSWSASAASTGAASRSRERASASAWRVASPSSQGDADTDLADYPDDSFDYVILSQTIQATRQPRQVLEHMLRIGRRAIVSFPNFGHWRIRLELGLKGRMPVTEKLPYSWYDTPNIHFCTIRDFVALCDEVGAQMERAVALNAGGEPVRVNVPWWVWNLFGESGVFLLRRR